MKVSSPILLKIVWLPWRHPSRKNEKEVQIDKNHKNTFHSVKNFVKIGPEDPEIIWVKLKR